MPKSHTRYQIFVSSTYIDLKEERQAAVEAILRAGHIPAGMELFAAQNRPQMEVIQEWIEGSDIFCLILGARYGSIEPVSGRSYVECEYDHATNLRKPVFSLVLDDSRIDANVHTLGRKVALEQENEPLLKSFKARITDTLVRLVGSSDAIKVAVFEGISTLERQYDIDGWVRAKDAQVSPTLTEELARLSSENARLSKELSAAKATKESLIAGKSYEAWAAILGQTSYWAWDQEAKAVSNTKTTTLLGALDRHGSQLGAGVDNSAMAGAYGGWLFGIATALASLGLAETKKTPPRVHWTRLALSPTGQRLYTEMLSRHSAGDVLVAKADVRNMLAEELLGALKEKQSKNATTTASAPKDGSASTPRSVGKDISAATKKIALRKKFTVKKRDK